MAEVATKPKANGANGAEHKAIEDGLNPSDVVLDFGNKTQQFFGKMPEGLPLERWGEPLLWRKAVMKFTMYDRIVCVDQGMTTWAEFMVVDLDKRKGDVRLLKLRSIDLPPRKRNALSEDLARDFEVIIGVDGYRARRRDDHSWLGQWQKTEDIAFRDVVEHSKRARAQ